LTDNISGCRQQPPKFAKTTGQLNRTNTCMKKDAKSLRPMIDRHFTYAGFFFNVERSAKL
jgi:hypothetical protein